MAEAMNVGLLAGADSGEKVVVGLGVAEVGASMQRFGWPDYVVFVIMLLLCVVVGFYFGFVHSATSAQDYLMGGRNMKTFPVAMSLIARYLQDKKQ